MAWDSEVGVTASSLQLQPRTHSFQFPPPPHILLEPSIVASSMGKQETQIYLGGSAASALSSSALCLCFPPSGFVYVHICACVCKGVCTLLVADADEASIQGSYRSPGLLYTELQREFSLLLS